MTGFPPPPPPEPELLPAVVAPPDADAVVVTVIREVIAKDFVDVDDELVVDECC